MGYLRGTNIIYKYDRPVFMVVSKRCILYDIILHICRTLAFNWGTFCYDLKGCKLVKMYHK